MQEVEVVVHLWRPNSSCLRPRQAAPDFDPWTHLAIHYCMQSGSFFYLTLC